MSPDDPRHGTTAGAVRHWKDGEPACDQCLPAWRRESKLRKLEAHRGKPRRVPALGYQRRIRALMAIGYRFSDIHTMLGVSHGCLSNRLYRNKWISRANHDALDALYEHLCMTPHPNPDQRTLRAAQRHRWAPPLAWDDIDNDAEPNYGHVETRSSLIEDFDFLTHAGESEEQALARLGVTKSAIEIARKRAA